MKAAFGSRLEYERFVLNAVLNLARLITAAILWLSALTILVSAPLAAWLLGVTGTEVAAALRNAWHSSTALFLSGVGVSFLTLCSAGWWIAKRLHRWLGREVVLPYLQGKP